MKAFFFLLGLVAAQNLEGEPACATPCLVSAISAAGCAANDQACQCGPTQAVIGNLAAGCLIGACAAADLLQAQSAGASLCAAYSATATGIVIATSSSSSISGSSTAVPTTTAAPSTSSGLSSAPSTTASSASGTTAPSTTAPSTTRTVLSTASSITSAAGTSRASSASAASSSSAGAASNGVAVGMGALAAVFGAIAAL